MVAKYVRKLENREINPDTGKVWSINDVKLPWYAKTKAKVEADHYTWDEDGTAIPIPPNEDEVVE